MINNAVLDPPRQCVVDMIHHSTSWDCKYTYRPVSTREFFKTGLQTRLNWERLVDDVFDLERSYACLNDVGGLPTSFPKTVPIRCSTLSFG